MMNKDAIHQWHRWANNHLIHDIRSDNKMSPVPLFDEKGWEHGASDQFNRLHLDLPQEPSYVYILYLDDNPADDKWQVENIRPVYIGQTSKKSDSTYTGDGHIHNLQKTKNPDKKDASPKYQDIVNICDMSDSRLYSWTRPISEIEEGPFGYDCNAEELEGKICSLLHQIPSFRRTLTNRGDYIPNWSIYERNVEQGDWIQLDSLPDTDPNCWESLRDASNKPKEDLWSNWIDEYLIHDINSGETDDPIPLFNTTSKDLKVKLTGGKDPVLERSDAIEDRIIESARKCMMSSKPRNKNREGILYIMYKLENNVEKITDSDIIPIYIGKSGVWGLGRKDEKLNKNFQEFTIERDSTPATNRFARWGDIKKDYHIGGVTESVKSGNGETKYLWWAQDLFEPKSRCLEDEVYLWAYVWDRSQDEGPYQTTPPLPAVESQLVALAYEVSPETLLNKDGVPHDARRKQDDPEFEPPEVWRPDQSNFSEF